MNDPEVNPTYGVPILDAKTWAVVEAAEAFMDQLCTFNDFHHPEVKKQCLRLQEAIGARYHSDEEQP